jgi:hypothetical protein
MADNFLQGNGKKGARIVIVRTTRELQTKILTFLQPTNKQINYPPKKP